MNTYQGVEWNMGFDPQYAGVIPYDERTVEQQRMHEQMVDDTPTVTQLFTGNYYNKDRPRQWELVKVAIEKGYVPEKYVRKGTLKNINQQTGSCVWAGAAQAKFWASVVDAIYYRQPDRIVFPSLYHYGRGRLHSGIRGRGEGSTGAGQAKAIQEDGFLDFDQLDLPAPAVGDVIKWTSSEEMKWSDGAAIAQRYIEAGRTHRVKTCVRVATPDDAAVLADTYHTFTNASDWGGQMRCPVVDGVLLNKRTTTWWHQMFILDYIEHPRLGRLWWVGNNWGYVHGSDPGGDWDNGMGAPEGGFYITDADLKHMLSHREVFGFLDFEGTEDPSRDFSWLMG